MRLAVVIKLFLLKKVCRALYNYKTSKPWGNPGRGRADLKHSTKLILIDTFPAGLGPFWLKRPVDSESKRSIGRTCFLWSCDVQSQIFHRLTCNDQHWVGPALTPCRRCQKNKGRCNASVYSNRHHNKENQNDRQWQETLFHTWGFCDIF